MHRLIAFAAALCLFGCVAKMPNQVQGHYREASAPMYSSAVLDRSRLVGRWKQVAAFGPKGAACRPGGVDIKGGASLAASFRLCLSGADQKGAGPMQPIGPGRFGIAGQEWWILWADGDYRTLVIGTPSGGFGFVLNRGGAISADRMKAAREILEWNGYDLRQFHSLAG